MIDPHTSRVGRGSTVRWWPWYSSSALFRHASQGRSMYQKGLKAMGTVAIKSSTGRYVNSRMTEGLPMGNSCGVITNVMGPSFPLYCAGAQLVQYYPIGLLTVGGGLFHSVSSMTGTLSISAIADREAMPHPEYYRQCLDNSFRGIKRGCGGALTGREPGRERKVPVINKAPGKRKASVNNSAAALKKAATRKNRDGSSRAETSH